MFHDSPALREFADGLLSERRLLGMRLAFALAIAALTAWIADPTLAIVSAVILIGAELLGAHLDDRVGYGPASAGRNARRVAMFVVISIIWAAGPVLAFPHLTPDLQLVVPFVWVGALLVHSTIYSYRSIIVFAIVMSTKIAALLTLVVWSAQLGLIEHLPAWLIVTILLCCFAIFSGWRHRDTDQAIETSQRDLQAALEAAEAANRSKSDFLANMSHELRTPLNAIIGYSEIVQDEIRDTELEHCNEDLQRILRSSWHLLGLINEVLDLSKIEADKMEVLSEAVDVPALIKDAVDLLGDAPARNNNQLRLDVDNAPAAVQGDPSRIRQCLINLLGNACKFTTDGTVTLRVYAGEGSLDAHAVFEVADTGIGMTAQQIGNLFQPFVQADATIHRQFGGTGLGLAITQQLARLMGGDVSVESKLGEGSVFRLSIPLAQADRPEASHDAKSDAPGEDNPRSPARAA